MKIRKKPGKHSKLQPQRPDVSGNHDPQVIGCTEAALKYLNKGYSVIPIGNDKKPLISWLPYQSRLPKVDQVKKWYSTWSDAGVAIVTGKISDIVVIDVDPRNEGRVEDFDKYNTVTSITGGNGCHKYFRYPGFKVPTIPNVLRGVDLKSDGGYVIVPPSTHPNGNQYKWKKDILENTPLSLPADLTDLVKSRQNIQSSFDSTLLSGVTEGNRNHSAASVIGKWLKLYPESEWETEVWPTVLLWNQKCSPPLSDRELRSVFLSIVHYRLKKQI